jgi:Na+-transporting methylmalonyl-CoA/oxaloacetate decarboxylase gamma subunit
LDGSGDALALAAPLGAGFVFVVLIMSLVVVVNFAGVIADKAFHGLNESGASLVVEIGGGGS